MAEGREGPLTLSLAGRSALVTGGTRGIGRIIAERLLEAGAAVAICARRAPESLPSAGGRAAAFLPCDVRRAEECRSLVEAVAERQGGLDLLVNNAGGSPAAEAATASPRFSEAIVALNLLAPLHLAQAAHAVMGRQERGGTIVNIASVAGRRPSPGTAIYGAAKAGLLSLTTSLAQEWGPLIRVNAVVVGLVETEDAARTYGSEAARAAIAASTPMGRMGAGADVADAVLFLASSFAGFVSGAALEVHGGGEPPLFLDLVRRHAPAGA